MAAFLRIQASFWYNETRFVQIFLQVTKSLVSLTKSGATFSLLKIFSNKLSVYYSTFLHLNQRVKFSSATNKSTILSKKSKGQFKIKNIQKILWTSMWILWVYSEVLCVMPCGETTSNSGKNNQTVE